MMEIKKNITDINKTIMESREIKYIVIHYVGAVSTAEDNTKYFKSIDRQASAHYFVDDNSIWQCVEENDIAWHCGGGLQGLFGHKYYKKCLNYNSIGIEMCCYKNANNKLDISEQTIFNTVELVKELMQKYNIPVENVIRHYDVTGKKCPAPFVSNTSRWETFKSMLNLESTQMPYCGIFPRLPLRGYFYYDHKRKRVKDKGTQVGYLQMFLNWAIDGDLEIDKSFGPLCSDATLKYQEIYGLETDRFFGPGCLEKAKTIKK